MVEPGIVATASFKGPFPSGFKVGYPLSAQTKVSYFPREHPKIYFWNAKSVALRQQKLFLKIILVLFRLIFHKLRSVFPLQAPLPLCSSLWLTLSGPPCLTLLYFLLGGTEQETKCLLTGDKMEPTSWRAWALIRVAEGRSDEA